MKNKKLKKGIVSKIIIVLIGVILIGTLIYKVLTDFVFTSKTEVKKEIDTISLYGYSLNDTDGKLYKSNFKELSKILKEETVDYEQYASTITKLFIIDFYSLDSSLSSTDIGGLEFIHPDNLENFQLNASDTMYKNVETNMDKTRTQSLPKVNEVTINSVTPNNFKYKEKPYESYLVDASWIYEEDMGYESKGKFSIIKDGIKLYIVECD